MLRRLLALVLLFLGYSGLGISFWPNIIPPASRSAPPPRRRKAWASRWSGRSIIPMILAYTGVLLRVSRQGSGGRGLPLMAPPPGTGVRQFGWLILIWTLSVPRSVSSRSFCTAPS